MAIALRQVQARAVAEAHEGFAAVSLEELVSGQVTDADTLAERAATLGWDLEPPRAVLLATCGETQRGPGVTELRVLAAAARQTLGADAIVWVRSRNVAALVVPSSDDPSDRRRLATALQREAVGPVGSRTLQPGGRSDGSRSSPAARQFPGGTAGARGRNMGRGPRHHPHLRRPRRGTDPRCLSRRATSLTSSPPRSARSWTTTGHRAANSSRPWRPGWRPARWPRPPGGSTPTTTRSANASTGSRSCSVRSSATRDELSTSPSPSVSTNGQGRHPVLPLGERYDEYRDRRASAPSPPRSLRAGPAAGPSGHASSTRSSRRGARSRYIWSPDAPGRWGRRPHACPPQSWRHATARPGVRHTPRRLPWDRGPVARWHRGGWGEATARRPSGW